MEKFININEMVFSNTPAENILHYIRTSSAEEIRKATPATVLRIINECKNESGDFWINCDRRAGNDWNSNIEHLYVNNNKPIIMLYVQGGNTDCTTSVSYEEFNKKTGYNGFCRLGAFTYDATDVVNVIRCILCEYIYWKYIEREAREKQERVAKVLNYRIINPVVDYFYKDMRLDKLPFSYATTTPRYDKYCKGKEAIEKYANEHVEELYGKTAEELQAIYKKAFREAANW